MATAFPPRDGGFGLSENRVPSTLSASFRRKEVDLNRYTTYSAQGRSVLQMPRGFRSEPEPKHPAWHPSRRTTLATCFTLSGNPDSGRCPARQLGSTFTAFRNDSAGLASLLEHGRAPATHLFPGALARGRLLRLLGDRERHTRLGFLERSAGLLRDLR